MHSVSEVWVSLQQPISIRFAFGIGVSLTKYRLYIWKKERDNTQGRLLMPGRNFYIGGYQPAQKWLKDRKGRALTNTDIEHYQKIIVALAETNRIIKEIDYSNKQ